MSNMASGHIASSTQS